jgi:superfamily II DNA or RNA helicase
MKSIRLAPVRHDEPDCLDYDDEDEVRRFEIAMRVHRAHAEAYSVTPLDGRVDGAYRVVGKTGSSGEAWVVDIVDASGTHDACTCHDFLGNDLGTCKHLEAVRRAIARVPDLRRGFARLGHAPRTATLTVAGIGGARLVEVGPWKARLRSRLGIVRDAGRGEVTLADTAPLLAGFRDAVRVVHAAPRAAALGKEQGAIADRRDAVNGAARAGRLRFDMLTHPLFSYQETGAAHLVAAGRALLADDMGLGKTIQAIAACELLRTRGEAARVLIVTCASLKHQWQREIERFAGERATVIRGGRPQRRAAFESDAPYKILNYELTWHELAQLTSLDADVVVYDEAQRAKNFRTKTAATLRAIPSRFTFILTGTPVENRLDDLYSLLQLVAPRVLGPLWKFNLEFAQQNERGRIVGYKNLSVLRDRIAPVVLRRRKEDVLAELPPLTEQTRYTRLTAEQADLEMGYRRSAAMLMQIAERRPLIKAEQDQLMMALLKARQACNAVELCDPKSRVKASPKLDELEALLAEILAQASAKVLVFSEWVEMLKLCAKRLDRLRIGYAMLHGSIPTDRRPALLDRFREQSDVRVLLSTEAGGVGLNLQVASYVVHLDLPWNPARLDQRTSRAHRMGQTRGVTVTYLCAEDGIERGIEGILATKRAVRGAALDAASTVETVETPSFNAMLQQVREILEHLEEPGSEGEVEIVVQEPSAAEPRPAPAAATASVPARVASSTPVALPIVGESGRRPAAATETDGGVAIPGVATDSLPVAVGGETRSNGAGLAKGMTQARERLRLARVVLDAGFPADAARAAYEALARAIAGLLDKPPQSGHAALVAAVYRDLLPAGRLPAGAHAALAMLHDLGSLDGQGVAVDADLASRAVDEAEQWVERLCALSTHDPSSNGEHEKVAVALVQEPHTHRADR